MGYVGPYLILQLRHSCLSTVFVGIDLGFFALCLIGIRIFPEQKCFSEICKDVRDVERTDFEGFDAEVHLAAVSNDLKGNIFERLTDKINCQLFVKIPGLAKIEGMRNYAFSSSCSLYDKATEFARKEEGSLYPLTASAKSKINTGLGLKVLNTNDSLVTCHWFHTACSFLSS